MWPSGRLLEPRSPWLPPKSAVPPSSGRIRTAAWGRMALSRRIVWSMSPRFGKGNARRSRRTRVRIQTTTSTWWSCNAAFMACTARSDTPRDSSVYPSSAGAGRRDPPYGSICEANHQKVSFPRSQVPLGTEEAPRNERESGSGTGAEMIRRVAMLCLHSSPLDDPGAGAGGGMNVYVRELARALAEAGIVVDIFTRSPDHLRVVEDAPRVRVIA